MIPPSPDLSPSWEVPFKVQTSAPLTSRVSRNDDPTRSRFCTSQTGKLCEIFPSVYIFFFLSLSFPSVSLSPHSALLIAVASGLSGAHYIPVIILMASRAGFGG